MKIDMKKIEKVSLAALIIGVVIVGAINFFDGPKPLNTKSTSAYVCCPDSDQECGLYHIPSCCSASGAERVGAAINAVSDLDGGTATPYR